MCGSSAGLAAESTRSVATLIGNGRTSVRWPPRFTAKRSHSMRDSSVRSTVFEKVVAVRLNVKADQVGAEQPVQQFALPGADPEGLGIRPGNMPENRHARVGALFLDHRGKQREVVVLHQHDGAALRRDLFQQRHARTCG